MRDKTNKWTKIFLQPATRKRNQDSRKKLYMSIEEKEIYKLKWKVQNSNLKRSYQPS